MLCDRNSFKQKIKFFGFIKHYCVSDAFLCYCTCIYTIVEEEAINSDLITRTCFNRPRKSGAEFAPSFIKIGYLRYHKFTKQKTYELRVSTTLNHGSLLNLGRITASIPALHSDTMASSTRQLKKMSSFILKIEEHKMCEVALLMYTYWRFFGTFVQSK